MHSNITNQFYIEIPALLMKLIHTIFTFELTSMLFDAIHHDYSFYLLHNLPSFFFHPCRSKGLSHSPCPLQIPI